MCTERLILSIADGTSCKVLPIDGNFIKHLKPEQSAWKIKRKKKSWKLLTVLASIVPLFDWNGIVSVNGAKRSTNTD